MNPFIAITTFFCFDSIIVSSAGNKIENFNPIFL